MVKDYKPQVASHNPCRKNNYGTAKNPHTIRKRVEHGVPGVLSGLYATAVIGSRCCGIPAAHGLFVCACVGRNGINIFVRHFVV